MAALYIPNDSDSDGWEYFTATNHVRSGWGPDMQHGGPVAALLTRALRRCDPVPNTEVARITVDLLGPVPIGQVRVQATVQRPGKRIQLTAATMQAPTEGDQWRTVATATAWRLATQDTSHVTHNADPDRAKPTRGVPLDARRLPGSWASEGFIDSVDWHIEPRAGDGPTVAWLRLKHDLIDGERPDPLDTVAAIADNANGIGARLDPRRYAFLNTDMTMNLHTQPRSAWIGLAAETTVGPNGAAMSAATIHDEHGPIGRVTQTVLVEARPTHV